MSSKNSKGANPSVSIGTTTEFEGPWRITFDTNPDDCNLHCIMCEDHSPYSATQADRLKAGLPKRRMEIGLIRRILAESKGSPLREIIPSTMGEPLLYRHFDEILDLCAEYGVKLNLTTNGTFPQRGARAWAERIVPVASDVKVSWNGATGKTQEEVMLNSNWETVLDNVRTFIAVRDEHALRGGNRCRVTFQLTFMEINYLELPGIVELAAGIGVDRVKGHHLWVHLCPDGAAIHAPGPRRHYAVECCRGSSLSSGRKVPSAPRGQGAAGECLQAGRGWWRGDSRRRTVPLSWSGSMGGL